MRSIIHLSLSVLIAFCLITLVGCKDSGSTTVAKSDTSHSDHDDDSDHGDDHDHGDEDDDHDHGEEHKHPETYAEAVGQLVEMHTTISTSFAEDKADDAHGPLHDIGHLLEDTESLVEKSDMDDETKKQLHEAIEEMFASYGAVDDKMHDEDEGKSYSEVAEQIEDAVRTLKQAAKPKE